MDQNGRSRVFPDKLECRCNYSFHTMLYYNLMVHLSSAWVSDWVFQGQVFQGRVSQGPGSPELVLATASPDIHHCLELGRTSRSNLFLRFEQNHMMPLHNTNLEKRDQTLHT